MKFKIIPNEQTPIASEVKNIIFNQKLFEKFMSFVYRQKKCAGLAANQVSLDGERLNLNFFAMINNHVWDIIINPTIIEYIGEKERKKERCLTWLGKEIIAERWHSISVGYQNLQGYYKANRISGFQAQVWQHEYNHLMGIEENFIPKTLGELKDEIY